MSRIDVVIRLIHVLVLRLDSIYMDRLVRIEGRPADGCGSRYYKDDG